MEKKEKSITKKTENTLSVSARDFQTALTEQKEKRELIRQFIAEQMKDKTDYGTIKIGGRESKPCLFKPGAEKFCELLRLQSRFRKDNETLEGLSENIKQNTVAFVCELIKDDRVIGEGRGSCSLQEKQGNLNTVIKIAEKRAHIDAVIRNPIIGLSDIFTQDLEDMPVSKPPAPKPVSKPPAEQKPVEPKKILWRDISKILTDKKYPQDKWADITGYKTLEGLSVPELQSLKTLLEGMNEYKEADNANN